MTVKVTFFLNAIRAANYVAPDQPPTGVAGYRGLSESWYSAKAFDSQDLYDTCVTWMNKRVPMMPRNSTIVAFRQQEVGALGKSIVYKAQKVGTNTFIQDQSEAALKYKVRSTQTSSERIATIAMVPDDIIRGGVYAFSDDWLGYANAFFDHIKLNWQMRIIDQTQTAYPIVSIDTNGNVVTDIATTFNADSKVQVLRSKTEENNTGSGVFYLAAAPTDAKHFKLSGWKFGPTEKGAIRNYVIAYNAVDVNSNLRQNPDVGTRKIGRPYGESRGKASKRR